MKPKKNKKILIAEDERPMAKALKLKLEKLKYQVTNVFDGEDAIKEIDKNKYDLIVLDIIMPKKDGYKVLDYINTIKTKIPPILILSNLSQGEDSKKALKMGASDYVIKSNISISDLITKINSYL